MPDDSNNPNTRVGAMAPDASTSPVEWGPEIRVDGKRPEWLANGVSMRWAGVMQGGKVLPYVTVWSQDCVNWNPAGNGCRIRLPADHPHYRHATTSDRDPLWDRMEALVRDIGEHSLQTFVYSGDATALNGWIVKARGIVADLPKPVDPATAAVERLLSESVGGFATTADETLATELARKAFALGRQHAAPEVSHVG